MSHESNGILPEGGKQMYGDWPEKEMKHCHHYLQALHPISLLPFVGWPIPASLLFIICDL